MDGSSHGDGDGLNQIVVDDPFFVLDILKQKYIPSRKLTYPPKMAF